MFRFSNRSISVLFLSSLFISISITQAKSQDTDPCNNISGNWRGNGKWYGFPRSCSYDADVKFTKYANTIRMEYHYFNSDCNQRENTFVWTGTCKDALLTFDDGKGTIFDNVIYIKAYNDGGTIETKLTKQ